MLSKAHPRYESLVLRDKIVNKTNLNFYKIYILKDSKILNGYFK